MKKAAYLTDTLLREIEDASDIKWADGDPPTRFLVKAPSIVVIHRKELVYSLLAVGCHEAIKIENATNFVALCSEICPKKEKR